MSNTLKIDEERRRENEFFSRLNRKFPWPAAVKEKAVTLLKATGSSPFGTLSSEDIAALSEVYPSRAPHLLNQEITIAERLFNKIWHSDCYKGMSCKTTKKIRKRLDKAMKIWVASDLHLDVMRDYARRLNLEEIEFTIPEDADLIILAGDISEGISGLKWASSLGKAVIYIAGNHEFYGHCLEELELELRRVSEQFDNVYFLHNDCIEIAGIRFLGSTLWTDYRLSGDERVSMSNAESLMSEHRAITKLHESGRRRFFRPQDAQNIHFRCREWLERSLAVPFDGPTIVITHHLPHVRSVHPTYLGTSPINPSFASDLTDILEKYDIDVWIHGHTHQTFDYQCYDTRVVCNPFGYFPTAETNDFDPELIIEVD